MNNSIWSSSTVVLPRLCVPDLEYLIRAEYGEMPGLSLTLSQAAKLWNVDRGTCLRALESLAQAGYLYRSRDVYLRTGCGRASA